MTGTETFLPAVYFRLHMSWSRLQAAQPKVPTDGGDARFTSLYAPPAHRTGATWATAELELVPDEAWEEARPHDAATVPAGATTEAISTTTCCSPGPHCLPESCFFVRFGYNAGHNACEHGSQEHAKGRNNESHKRSHPIIGSTCHSDKCLGPHVQCN